MTRSEPPAPPLPLQDASRDRLRVVPPQPPASTTARDERREQKVAAPDSAPVRTPSPGRPTTGTRATDTAARPSRPTKPIPLPLVIAHLKLWGWQLLTKGLLGFVYVAVIADGLRYLFPAFGMKLWKLPLLADLRNYEGTHRLDLAPFLALFLMLAVFYFWHHLLRIYLRREWERHEDDNEFGWDGQNQTNVLLSVGGLTIVADLIIFYIAVTRMGWSGATFSITAVIATAAYLGVLLFVSYVSVVLHETIRLLKSEK